jgi:hypothetical protein
MISLLFMCCSVRELLGKKLALLVGHVAPFHWLLCCAGWTFQITPGAGAVDWRSGVKRQEVEEDSSAARLRTSSKTSGSNASPDEVRRERPTLRRQIGAAQGGSVKLPFGVALCVAFSWHNPTHGQLERALHVFMPSAKPKIQSSRSAA